MNCDECGIPLTFDNRGLLCDVCITMYAAVRNQPGLFKAHEEWETENMKRALAKQRMMKKESQ